MNSVSFCGREGCLTKEVAEKMAEEIKANAHKYMPDSAVLCDSVKPNTVSNEAMREATKAYFSPFKTPEIGVKEEVAIDSGSFFG